MHEFVDMYLNGFVRQVSLSSRRSQSKFVNFERSLVASAS